MSENEINYLSATALAKRHNISSKEMFVYLVNHGYIERRGDVWSLTNEGISAGGRFVKGKQFGKYIVWPENIALDIQTDKLMSTAALAKHVGLQTETMIDILLKIGWILQGPNGHLITPAGKDAGGLQDSDPKKNENLVRWPKTITEVERLKEELIEAGGVVEREESSQPAIKSIPKEKCEWQWRADDGHFVMAESHGYIDNFLFEQGIVHSYGHVLDDEEKTYVHFYLPKLQSAIYIRPNSSAGVNGSDAGVTNGQLRLLCRKHGIRMIELEESQAKQPEHILAKALYLQG